MLETAEQYRQRMLALVEDRKPLIVQAATAERLRQLFRGVPDRIAHRQPAPGKWSPAQVLAHLADCELVYGYRIRTILASPGAPIQPFDQDRWAETFEYHRIPPAESLAVFAAARRNNLRLLCSLRPEQWRHHGQHAERGPETVALIVSMLAGHDLNHLRQIEDRLPRRRPAPRPGRVPKPAAKSRRGTRAKAAAAR